jgi:hypothetical protein
LVVCKRLLYVEVGCLQCWFYTIWSHSLLLLLFRSLCSCYPNFLSFLYGFWKLSGKINTIVEGSKGNLPNIILGGDFNLPHIDWGVNIVPQRC